MLKRQFLSTAALAAALPVLPVAAAPRSAAGKGPTLLTLTGAISRSNRGAFDPALDQMMKKHKLAFNKAYALDFAALSALPQVTIRPTLEYDGKVHELRGPLLADVVALAGAATGDKGTLALRAVDGYAATMGMAQAKAQRFIVATHIDGQSMALGGLGPLWAVLDADRLPELAAKPLAERFGNCPWALYHIDVG